MYGHDIWATESKSIDTIEIGIENGFIDSYYYSDWLKFHDS